jgi:hypothetical protein
MLEGHIPFHFMTRWSRDVSSKGGMPLMGDTGKHLVRTKRTRMTIYKPTNGKDH